MSIRQMSLALAVAVAAAAACDADRDVGVAGPSFGGAPGARVFVQRERLANPLVSEVTVRKARHAEYNRGQPSTDVAQFTGDVSGFVTGVAGRDQALADLIAAVLLPDMLLVYPARSPATAGWLSWAFGGYGGRRLTDDVVDVGLLAIFGPLLDPNDVTPGLTTDNVGANDVAFGATFPYVAAAH
jgi:hypothetical protein